MSVKITFLFDFVYAAGETLLFSKLLRWNEHVSRGFLRLYHAFVFFFFFFILILSALLTDRSAKRSTFFLTRQIGGKGNKMHILRVIFVCTEKRGVINSYSCATFPRSVTCGIFTTSVKY